jgi:hypothetical protein
MYGYAILCSTDFRRTMDFAVRYHQLAAPLATISFAETRQHGIWTIKPFLHPQMDAELYRFAVELQFGTHVSLHRDVMGSVFAPREVYVSFRPRGAEPLPELMGCSVRFEQPANPLIFDADWLDAVPTLGNRITFSAVIEVCDELLEGMARRTGVAGKIREILLQTLANRPTLDEIARLLGTTARTLRRQLRVLLVQRRNACLKLAASLKPAMSSLVMVVSCKYLMAMWARRSSMSWRKFTFSSVLRQNLTKARLE